MDSISKKTANKSRFISRLLCIAFLLSILSTSGFFENVYAAIGPNLSLTATASNDNPQTGLPAANINDGDITTRCVTNAPIGKEPGSTDTAKYHWFILEWQEPQTINTIRVYSGSTASEGYQILDYTLSYWTGSEWSEPVAVVTSNSMDLFKGMYNEALFKAVTTTKIRMDVQKGGKDSYNAPAGITRLSELECYYDPDLKIDTFKVNLTLVKEMIENYKESGDLGNPIYKQLINSIDQAGHHKTSGRTAQAIHHLENAVKHLDNKGMEKFISDEAKSELKAYISQLAYIWGLPAAKDLNPVTFKEAPEHPPVVLVEDETAMASICVMAETQSAALKKAIKELQEDIKLTTGAELPIVYGEIRKPGIIIGDNAEAAALGLEGANMPAEGFEIKTDDDAVYIVGNEDGTAWGVFEFLERFVGVRWFWPTDRGGRSIIITYDLIIDPVWLEDAPVYRMRQAYPPAANGPDGTRQVLTEHDIVLRMGNSWPAKLVVHSPRWHNAEDIRTQRPEVFQLRADGTRDYNMICYSNPRTLETYLEEIARVYDEGQPASVNRMGIIGDTITVSPNDASINCYCDDCRALWVEDGGRYGTASIIMAEFVNKLALAVKERWPDKKVMFLPYLNYMNAPEGYQFPDNVHIQLCSSRDGIASYKEPAILASEQQNLDNWDKLTSNLLTTWHYSCWPSDQTKSTYQFPHVLKDYYQHNKDKLAGTFINGGWDHWPQHHISMYAWYKLLWNPDFDVDAAIEEYCRRMFGVAADTIGRIIELETEGWENSRWPDAKLTPKALYEYSFPPEVMEEIKSLLEQAESQLAGNTVRLNRLNYFKIPFPNFFQEYDMVVNGGARPLVVKKVNEDPVIDGRLDDSVWQEAAPVSLVKYNAVQGEIPVQFPTQVMGVWTANGFTIGMKMDEPDTAGLKMDILNNDDPMLWHQDCVEMFFDVSGLNVGKFYQFIVNAAGTVWDAKEGSTAWNVEGMQTKVFIGDGYWSIEAFFPVGAFDEIQAMKYMEWYGQFTRHRHPEGKTEAVDENQKMNATFGGRNSNLADFAQIIFME